MSTTPNDDTARVSRPTLYALIAGGIAVAAAVAALSFTGGGLPGTPSSPSATVNGQPIVGKSGGG
jgi:hypothetical protein